MWRFLLRLVGRPTTDAERAVWDDFRKDHVMQSPWVRTVADEPTRIVVRLKFTPHNSRIFRRHYAVDKQTMAVEHILDDAEYQK